MEAAGTALAEAVAGLAPRGPVRIVCGKGNNGGDGEVAARHLRGMGFEVEAVRSLWSDDVPADLDRWLAGSGAVVDAIFGTGFEGAPREPAAGAIEAINRCGAPVVACDIASGVDASSGEIEGVAVEADLTVSFHGAEAGAADRARASGTRASCGWWRSGSRRARRARPRAASSTRRSWRWRRAAARARPSSAPARWRSPAARAASPAPCGCPRRRRSGREPATPPSPFPPTSSRSSKRGSRR